MNTTFNNINLTTTIQMSSSNPSGTPTPFSTNGNPNLTLIPFTGVGTGTFGLAQKASYNYIIVPNSSSPVSVTFTSGQISNGTTANLTDPSGQVLSFGTMGSVQVQVPSNFTGTAHLYPAASHGVSWAELPGSLGIKPGNTWGPIDGNVAMTLASGSADQVSISVDSGTNVTLGLICIGR